MTTEKEISSTDRLLQIIRGSGGAPDPRSPQKPASESLWKKFRDRWLSAGPGGWTGVEIFRDAVNTVRMTRDRYGWQAVYAARAELPEGMSIDDPEFPYFLKTQLKNADPSGRTKIWTCLPPSKGEIWNVLVPKVRKGLTNAVYWSARRERAFEQQDYFFDYRIKGETTAAQSAPRLSARACIASAGDINFYKEVFSRAGYPLAGITLPAFSLENLFVHRWANPEEEAYAVLCIGDDSSYIEIRAGGTPVFNRVIKTGRDSILDSLSLELAAEKSPDQEPELSAEPDRQKAAEDLKKQAGFFGDSLLETIRPALERIARQLERTIDHSVNVLENPAPARIYICGTISFMPGLSDFFAEQLATQAVIMDLPEEKPGTESVFPEKEDRLCLVSTAGLAMPGQETVNFLHTAVDMDREKKGLRNANMVAAACALLFVAAGAWWFSARHELDQARAEAQKLENRLEQYSPLLTAEDLAELAGQLREKNEEIRSYSRRLGPVAALKEINRLTPENISLLSLRLENRGAGSEQNSGKPSRIDVEGFVKSEPSMYDTHLTGYMLKLRRSPIFTDTSVKESSRHTLETGENVYRFTLNMEMIEL